MMKKIVAGTLLSFSVAFAGSILPNNELQLGMLAQAAQNKLLVLTNMHLKGEAKDKFGDLYDEYQKDLMQVRLEKLKLIKSYAKSFKDMTDEKANTLLDQWLKLQKKELELKEKYIAKFKKILPASMVIRFYQIDNRMSLLREARVSTLIPLAIPEQAKRMEMKAGSEQKTEKK